MFDHLKDTCLFYPCSGPDWLEPIQRFVPHIREFWFVDPAYFRDGINARKLTPLLIEHPEYTHLDTRIEGDLAAKEETRTDPKTGHTYAFYIPCTVTEHYSDVRTGKDFVVHRHRGDGRHTLGRLIAPLGVFFHRGDNGPGKAEGSSGAHWLSKEWLTPVLEKLVDDGLIVSDGSCGQDYPELSKQRWAKLGEAAVDAVRPFTDSAGRVFTCIGYAGERYGPTLIWKVKKPA